MTQDTKKAGNVPSRVSISICTEREDSWRELVSVPVTTGSKGTARVPVVQEIEKNKKVTTLTDLLGSDDIFSVKREFEGNVSVTTYLPLKDIHFKFGKAAPVDPSELQANTKYVVGKLQTMIDGTYRCIKWAETKPVVYVVGHTDTVGTAKANQKLSERRAKVIAQAVRAESNSEVDICYAGVGETEAATEDNIPFPEARKVKVVITSEDMSSGMKWKCLKRGKAKQ